MRKLVGDEMVELIKLQKLEKELRDRFNVTIKATSNDNRILSIRGRIEDVYFTQFDEDTGTLTISFIEGIILRARSYEIEIEDKKGVWGVIIPIENYDIEINGIEEGQEIPKIKTYDW